MYFTMKDFKEKQIAVSFKNGWEQKRFLKECEKERLKWLSGSKATKIMIPVNKCIAYGYRYSNSLGYCEKEFYENKGWEVVKFNQILFGEWKEVKRRANVGDYIKLTNSIFSFDEKGDILKIDGLKEDLFYVLGKNHLRDTKFPNHNWTYVEEDYVVLEREEKEMRKFKVGDRVSATLNGKRLNGKIVEIDSGCANNMILVKFENWHDGHNGNGYSKEDYEGNSCWYLYDSDLKLKKEGEDIMKKSDLKNGAIVELRNGDKCILLLNTYCGDEKNDYFISLKNGGYIGFDYYDENLESKDGEKEFDIMKICQEYYVGDNFRNHVIYDRDKWTWKRQEEVVMTISEIEEKLGINGLKIKKEE